MDKFQDMISLADALAIVDRTLADVHLPAETAAARCAVGRTLLEDQVSRLDLPPFDKSAMDGYAVARGDRRAEYRLLETLPAGRVGRFSLEPGTTVKVMTGTPVPQGAGRVIILEQTTERDGVVAVHSHAGPTNICKTGEDVRAGDTILKAGTGLSPVDVANLISCGIMTVPVARAVRAAVISTGDEIVDSPDEIEPGRIMNSNGPMLAALARRFAMEVVSEESVSDDREATVSALGAALGRADMVILTGGVSVGEYDFVLDAMEDLDLRVHFTRVAVKPGKPTTCATLAGRVVLSLPGNPASAFLMFHVFVVRAADRMSGRRRAARELTLPLAGDFKRQKTGRTQYVPARLIAGGRLEEVRFHGSAHLAALSRADGFFVVPRGTAELHAGHEVEFLPVRDLTQ